MSHISIYGSLYILCVNEIHPYTHLCTFHVKFIYYLRFPLPCVVCHVLLDLGKFIRKKQQTAALIVISAQKMRFPMKQVHASKQKKNSEFDYHLIPNQKYDMTQIEIEVLKSPCFRTLLNNINFFQTQQITHNIF